MRLFTFLTFIFEAYSPLGFFQPNYLFLKKYSTTNLFTKLKIHQSPSLPTECKNLFNFLEAVKHYISAKIKSKRKINNLAGIKCLTL